MENEKSVEKKIIPNSRLDRFIQAFVTNGRQASKAVVEAGYSKVSPQTTANRLLKQEEVRNEIQRREATLLKSTQVSKEGFLLLLAKDYDSAKNEQTKVRIRQLQAEILGLTKPDTNTQQVALFSFDQAKSFLNSFKDTNTESPSQDTTEAVIVEPGESSRNTEHTTQVGGNNKDTIARDVYTTDSAQTIDIAPETGVGE